MCQATQILENRIDGISGKVRGDKTPGVCARTAHASPCGKDAQRHYEWQPRTNGPTQAAILVVALLLLTSASTRVPLIRWPGELEERSCSASVNSKSALALRDAGTGWLCIRDVMRAAEGGMEATDQEKVGTLVDT